MVRGEHDTLAEVRRQMRPGDFTGQRLEHDGMPLARMAGLILGIVDRALFLAHCTSTFPRPIQHGRVIGYNLALLIILVTRLAHGWELHIYPVLDRDGSGVALPVALALIDNLELRAEPINRLADQLVG